MLKEIKNLLLYTHNLGEMFKVLKVRTGCEYFYGQNLSRISVVASSNGNCIKVLFSISFPSSTVVLSLILISPLSFYSKNNNLFDRNFTFTTTGRL